MHPGRWSSRRPAPSPAIRASSTKPASKASCFWRCWRFGALRRPGLVTGLFVCGYALSRITVEFFREPDAQLGYLYGGWLTMGMLLSLPMLAVGVWAIVRARAAAPKNA